jgi:hypothetical protein
MLFPHCVIVVVVDVVVLVVVDVVGIVVVVLVVVDVVEVVMLGHHTRLPHAEHACPDGVFWQYGQHTWFESNVSQEGLL